MLDKIFYQLININLFFKSNIVNKNDIFNIIKQI